MKPHPSGRPLRNSRPRGRSVWNIPERGYVIARLREPDACSAIGFIAGDLPGHQGDDYGETHGKSPLKNSRE